MHRKFDNCWVDCRDPIGLMDCPSNVQIGLCWYQRGTNNRHTYDYIDHLMVDLEIIIALASTIYIANLDGYECQHGD